MSEKEIAEIEERFQNGDYATLQLSQLVVMLLATVKELRAERDAVSKQFADYIESTDLALDGYGVPNRDDVGRIGPYIRTVKLGNEVKELLQRDKEQRELLDSATEYMVHGSVCPAHGWSVEGCDCGYAELKKKIEGALK